MNKSKVFLNEITSNVEVRPIGPSSISVLQRNIPIELKMEIAKAITEMGVPTYYTDTIITMVNNILQIETPANLVAGDGIYVETYEEDGKEKSRISIKLGETEGSLYTNESGLYSQPRSFKATTYQNGVNSEFDIFYLNIHSDYSTTSLALNIDKNVTLKSNACIVIVKNNSANDVTISFPTATITDAAKVKWTPINRVTLNVIPAGGSGEYNFLFVKYDTPNASGIGGEIRIVGESVL